MNEQPKYDNGVKRQWRKWQWNRVKEHCERIRVPKKEAVVVYLAGAHDYDREWAVSQGFDERNLIAVDRDRDIVGGLRESGSLAVGASIEDAVKSWNPNRDLHAVLLDYTGGLTDARCLELVGWITLLPHTAGAMFVINLLRGRECGGYSEKHSAAADLNEKMFKLDRRHRGGHLAATMLGQWLGMLERHACGLGCHVDESKSRLCLAVASKDTGPRFMSYKSPDSNQVFDSVAIRSGYAIAGHTPSGSDLSKLRGICQRKFGGPVRRQLAAVMAHRTRRFQ